MTDLADITAAPEAPPEHYLVSHGKSGGLGSFVTTVPCFLRRGDRVIIDSPRGREIGTILGPAGIRQARILGAVASGTIISSVTATDEILLARRHALAQPLFEACRRQVRVLALPLEILDVEILLEERAIVQFVGKDDISLDSFASALGEEFRMDIRLENLAVHQTEKEESHGCGKPDCGKTEGGGCSTCSTGGGCSSCGTGATDLRPYFAHLRTQLEASHRTPLL